MATQDKTRRINGGKTGWENFALVPALRFTMSHYQLFATCLVGMATELTINHFQPKLRTISCLQKRPTMGDVANVGLKQTGEGVSTIWVNIICSHSSLHGKLFM